MKYEKSCGAIVYRKSRDRIELLLIQNRYGGDWSFPKGHVEGEETEVQTALREVKEETGLDIQLEDGFGRRWNISQSVMSKAGGLFSGTGAAWKSSARKRRSAASPGRIFTRPTTW